MRKFSAPVQVESPDKKIGPEKQGQGPGATELALNLGPASDLVCVLGQVAELLPAFVCPSVKWGDAEL